MADYSQFDPALASWLQKVWKERVSIQREMISQWVLIAKLKKEEGNEGFDPAASARKMGADEIYGFYNPGTDDKPGNEGWAMFELMLDLLKRRHGIEWETSNGWISDSWFAVKREFGNHKWRIYLRFVEPLTGWGRVAQYCLQDMDRKGVVEFKVAGPGISKQRGDHMVIWLKDDKSIDSMLQSLKADRLMACRFSGSVPPGVKQVAPGLGYSAEPDSVQDPSPLIEKLYKRNCVSFGEYLAGVIFLALEQSWNGNENDYVEKLLDMFLHLRIDPKQPHLLRNISEEEFRLIVKNAQGKIVSQRLTPEPSTGKDETKPLVCAGRH